MKTYIVILFVASCWLTGCQPSYQLLKSEKEDGFRLSDYPTFGFYDIEVSGDTSSKTFETNVGIIKEAIARNLQQKGLNEAQDPALKINIALSVREEVQTRQTDFRTDGLPRYMGQRRYSWKSEEVPVRKYKEGTILIDFVDLTNNKMVWRGGSQGILPKSKDFSDKVNQVMNDIFKKIPN
ncbi:DUF4136 domain-containing protein [Dyadobacter sp. NIV53]|uniref:DUF4136 domain-containing protein n=1 Tax=Dyadobacter sp. NIV53 TaxID=2861765 RepID=UPI001C86BEA5|nr:DUF4136 domain-containing protein [Dyadobacter sp. NIV53]